MYLLLFINADIVFH